MKKLLIALMAIAALASGLAQASETEHHGQQLHKHHVGIFLGNTHNEGNDEFTIGLEYERRLNHRWGIGGLLEHSGGEFDTTIIAAPIFFHPDNHWRLSLAPGLEYHNSESEFLLRASLAYEFDVSGWTMGPEVAVDWVDSETIEVYGITIGRGF